MLKPSKHKYILRSMSFLRFHFFSFFFRVELSPFWFGSPSDLGKECGLLPLFMVDSRQRRRRVTNNQKRHRVMRLLCKWKKKIPTPPFLLCAHTPLRHDVFRIKSARKFVPGGVRCVSPVWLIIECDLPNSIGLENMCLGKYSYETDELPKNPRPSQPKKKNRLKSGRLDQFFPHQIFFCALGLISCVHRK